MGGSTILKEMLLTFGGAFLMAMGWTAIIMRDGLKTPAEVIITMQNHLRDFGGYFIILDLLVFGLLIRWIHLARKPKALINVWE
jgi:hypothetical protein|tara:strand:+ start:142 stop:393 length:252 start_codon:yes stop_codon:yes gene_type:complete